MRKFPSGDGVRLFLSVLLFGSLSWSPLVAHALAKGPDGNCPAGSGQDPNNPNNCIPILDTVTVEGSSGGGWPDYLFVNWGGTWTPVIDRDGGSTTVEGVWERLKQFLQKNCDHEDNQRQAGSGQVSTLHPVMVTSGTKILPEFDFAIPSDGIALQVARNYTSGLSRIGAFGKYWTSSIDYSLVFEYQDVQCWTYLDRIQACNSGGKPLTAIYAYNPSGFPLSFVLKDGVWTNGINNTLTLENGRWVLRHESGARSFFDTNGRPLQILDERGLGLTYAYNATTAQLSTITHSSGRQVIVTWSSGKIGSITAPNNKVYTYGYVGSYLGSVTYPDGLGTRTYHYEDSSHPGYLTGVSINGVRYSRFTYFADGKVATSGLEGGVEKSSFVYGADYTDVTDSRGQTTRYRIGEIKGSKKVIGVEHPASSVCPIRAVYTAYDVNGNIDYELDGAGNKTTYAYDPKNRVTRRISGIGPNGETAGQQIAQFTWDPDHLNRLTSIQISGGSNSELVSETTYTYYDDGSPTPNLLKTVVVRNKSPAGVQDATLATSYEYTLHPNGLVATMKIDGPVSGTGDQVINTFDTAGNLISTKNSIGHTVSYQNYNALGQAGRIVSQSGGVRDFTFDARGNQLTETRWVGQTAYTTTTSYDNRGQAKRIQYPDGSEENFAYDTLGRLVSKTRKEKGSPYVPTSSGGSGAGLVAGNENKGGSGHGKLTPQGICADCEPGGEDPPPPPASEIRGVIDGITSNKTAIVGWACSSGLSQSISVHLYLGGAAGVGTYYGAYLADLASEPAVASACSASGTNYRFSIPMTTNMREQFGGKAIYVHGISPVGSANSLLTNSGSFTVSKMPPAPVGFTRYSYNLSSQVTKVESGIEYYSSDSSMTLASAGSSTKLLSGGEGIAACYPDCYEPNPQPGGTVTTLLQSSQFIDYDSNGFVSARRGNNGQVVAYSYNANGDVAKLTDGLGRTTRFEYDSMRRVNHVVDAAGGHTWTSYDALGNIVRVQDPKGNITTYVYDGLGQLWAQSSPDTGTTRFEWNAFGQRKKMTRQDGSWLNYDYDALGRLTSIGNDTESRVFKYQNCDFGDGNARGMQLCGMAASNGTWTQFRYTPEGLLQSRRDSTNGSDDWTGYSYDGMGRLTGISYPSGVSVGYGYNNGLLTNVTATINGVTSTVLDKAYYQPFGAVGGWTYGNGLARRYSYDLDGRLTGISTGDDAAVVVQSLGLGYNAADEITRITNGINANLTYNFGYDALSRLTVANTASIGYDPAGNRTSFNAQTYGIDPASNRLQYAADPSLTRYYNTNANGNVYAYTGTDGVYNGLTYDAFSRVVTHTRAGVVTNYSYNALDQRVSKSAGSIRFVYGGQDQLLAENRAGAWTSYIWLNRALVGVVRNSQLYYVHTDQVDRPEAITNSARSVVWRASNTPFNRAVTLDGFGGLSLGFPGQYWDAESGLWHNGFRHYEPTLGRYLQSDPMGLHGGINTYEYAFSNPISFTDPSGLCVDYLGLVFSASDVMLGGAEMQAGVPTAIIGAASGQPEVAIPGTIEAALGGATFYDGLMGIATAIDGKERDSAFEEVGGMLLGAHGHNVGRVAKQVMTARGLLSFLRAGPRASAEQALDAMKALKEGGESADEASAKDPCNCN